MKLVEWFDSRTGIRKVLHEALYESVPGGARWRYVWGSTLVFAFTVQLITGVFLWMSYSASRTTAWESVYYIQHELSGGWFLRGLHHFMAQAMVILLAIHLMQVVIDGAYKAPREVNFWLGLVLMLITLGLALTGYLLPWDQKGYWATRVATNLSGIVPGVGDATKKIALGGDDYGQATLTRFFALHAGVLPGLLMGFLALHIAVFRKHGLHAKTPLRKPDGMFWPDQILKDAIACFAVLACVVFCIFWPAISGKHDISDVGYLGAELGSPADASTTYPAARPEWYFLFLFQFLKLFEGMGEHGELIGAIVVPSVLMLFLFLMPILGKWKLGHRFNIMYLVIVLGGAGALTWAAIHEDTVARGVPADKFADLRKEIKIRAYDPDYDPQGKESFEARKKAFEAWEKSHGYLEAVEAAEREGARAVALAGGPDKIPATGALDMLRNDPATMGPRLFKQHCASCHDYRGPAGSGVPTITGDRMQYPLTKTVDGKTVVQREGNGNVLFAPSGAPNLYGFGSRAWIAGLLDKSHIVHVQETDLLKPSDPLKTDDPKKFLREVEQADYFGNTLHKTGEMQHYVDHDIELNPDQLKDVIDALSAEAKLPRQAAEDARDAARIKTGLELIASGEHCGMCHHVRGDENKDSGIPDLENYASREWTTAFIANPAHDRFYGKGNDRMPAFAPNSGGDSGNQLSKKDMELLVNWLRQEY